MYKKMIIRLCYLCVMLSLSGCGLLNEHSPIPLNEVAPVQKALAGIQGRNWQQYISSFEPTTKLDPIEPGIPGHFQDLQFEVIESAGDQARVWMMGEWVPSTLDNPALWNKRIYVKAEVSTLKAHGGVEFQQLRSFIPVVSIFPTGWFIRRDESDISFDITAQKYLVDPVPAPTGSFVLEREGDIWLVGAYNSRDWQLTSGRALDIEPEWSPNHEWIAFKRIEKDTDKDGRVSTDDNKQLHVLRLTGEHIRIGEEFDNIYLRGWLDDRAKLWFSAWRSGEKFESYDGIYNLLSKETILLPEGIDIASWSPNGTRAIWYDMTREGYIVFLGSADGTSIVSLGTEHSEVNPYRVEWSADGKYIAYVSTNRESGQDSDRNKIRPESLYIMTTEGNLIASLVQDRPRIGSIVWDKIGSQLAYTVFPADTNNDSKIDFEDESLLYLVDGPEYSEPREVLRQEGLFNVSWSPNSKYVGYTIQRKDSWKGCGHSLATAELKCIETKAETPKFTFGLDSRPRLEWSPDGTKLLLAVPLYRLGEFALYVIDMSTVELVQLNDNIVKLGGISPQVWWMPESKHILVEPGGFGLDYLYVVDLPAHKVKLLTIEHVYGAGGSAKHIPGTNLVYFDASRDISGDHVAESLVIESEIIMFDVVSGGWYWITRNPKPDTYADWAPVSLH